MDRRLRRPRRMDDFVPTTTTAQTRRSVAANTAIPAPTTTRTRASPSRNKVAPPPPDPPLAELGPRTRRSSRPRSAAGQPTVASTTVKATIKLPTPIKEINEIISSPVRNSSSFPLTLTTNTSSRAPNQLMATSSVNSPNSSRTFSSSTTTTQRIEIRSEGGTGDDVDTESIRKRLTDRLRRSLSKTISNMAGTTTPNNEDAGSRYSRSVSRSVYDDEKSSKRSYSTGEEDIEEEDEGGENEQFRSFNVTRQSVSPVNNVCRKLESPREFGGWMGALFLILAIPSLVYYLTWSCTARNACQFKRANLTALLDWHYLARQVFQTHVVGVFTAYQFVVFLLVALLPGRRVHLTRETYKFNGLGVCVTLLLAGGIAEYLKYPVVSFVLRHYLRFCIYGLMSAFVAATWSYFRVDTTKYNVLRQTLTNDYGRSGNFLVDFALGRQLNPKWLGRVDWKQYYYRLSLVSTLLYAACYIYQTLQWPQWPQEQQGYVYLLRYYWQHVNYDAGTLLAATSLLIYILDALLFEHHLSCSFELQHEGYGCLLLLRYAATPYLLSSVSKYFYEQRVGISCCFAPYTALLLLLTGLCIKRYSCAYKYKYRLNSQHPMFANIETIHTYQGSRLLLSGLWGRLRQPNYLGDILALCALGAPMFLRPAWPPLLSLLLLILVLLHRATRTNARNQGRYHSSWHRYCTQVRYYILPKIY